MMFDLYILCKSPENNTSHWQSYHFFISKKESIPVSEKSPFRHSTLNNNTLKTGNKELKNKNYKLTS